MGLGAAMGGLPAARPDQLTFPPPGGQQIPGSRTGRFPQVVIFGPKGQLLIYSGPPAAGNLVASISSAAGTDSKGNAFLAGVSSYTQSAPFLAANMNSGLVDFFKATSQAGPWGSNGNITGDTTGNLDLSASSSLGAVQILLGTLSALHGLTVTGGITADTEVLSSGQAGGLVLDSTNTTATPAAPNWRLTSAAAGDRGLALRVAGDAANRLQLDTIATGARIVAGSGAGAQDVALLRAAANQWAMDYTAFNNGGAAESWQAATFGAAGWVNSGAPGANLQYRRNAAPYKTVQWGGRITAPAGVAAGQNITTAVPAPYQPAHTQPIPCRNITTPGTAWLSIGSAGILQFQIGAVAGDVLDLAPVEISLDI
jgi:hypothetical protein